MPLRRDLLKRLAGATGVAGLAGCTRILGSTGAGRRTDLDLPANPRADRLPARQHALNDHLRRDADGNPLPPRHHAVALLDLAAEPSVEAAETVERALRTVEAAYDWAPDGLFHMLAWGPGYFDRVGALDRAPVRRPQVLSRTDDPELLDFDAALVLSSDVPSHVAAAEAALLGDRSTLNGVSVDDRLAGVFARRERRTGFIGEGLPSEHTDAEGIPDDAPLDETDRMFMGFKSSYRGTQASEDRVTIQEGPFEGGTTMHLSHLRQSLGRWFRALDEGDRVARMFSPEFSPADVDGFTDDVPFSDAVSEHAAEQGVVGHHEKVARAREGDEPLLLRRDFNTVDGGTAGVHFLALQRSLDDFARTRKAMNGWYLRDDSDSITDQWNNGILEFVTVASRANFCVPPRAKRSFPLL